MKENNLNVLNNNSGIVANKIDQLHMAFTPSLITNSILADILNLMISENYDFAKNIEINTSYEVEEKIKYNCVVKYRDIIKSYYAYALKCEDTINILDKMEAGKKNKILKFVNDKYLCERGQILLENKNTSLSEIKLIQNNSDLIIDRILFQFDALVKNLEKTNKYEYETTYSNLLAFIIYCFVECRILEKPIRSNVE